MHRRRETLGDRRRRGMDPVADRPSGRRPSRRASGRPGLENTSASSRCVGRHAEQRGLVAVDHQRVGARARRRGPSARSRPRRRRRRAARGEQALGGRRPARLRRGGDVALAQRQALAVFEQRSSSRQSRVTWLSEPIDSGTPAASQRGRSGRPSPRLASVLGHSTTPAPLRGHRVDLGRRGVRGMHQLPARIERRLARQPLDRPRAGGGDAVVAPRAVCSATWMWIGPASPLQPLASSRDRRRPTRRAASGSPRRHSTQRPARRARSPSRDCQHVVGRGARSGAGRRAAPARRSRRARTAPAAASGRCRPRPRHRPAPSDIASGSA